MGHFLSWSFAVPQKRILSFVDHALSSSDIILLPVDRSVHRKLKLCEVNSTKFTHVLLQICVQSEKIYKSRNENIGLAGKSIILKLHLTPISFLSISAAKQIVRFP